MKSIIPLVVASMTFGFLFAVPCAKAQTTLSMADTNFILAAAQGGMTEVKLGELASTSGVRDDVKSFGQMMVKDHTAINDDLMAGGLRIQRLTSAQPIHMVASILSSWCH